ncbi:MAG: 4-(cytidine 5'-diphospho)-2-C-methyl-D-erythritol kinase, partial [Simkaniaceae bacterium]|nr:4-(cytidine 5'-diphospho)-2-C-methyl-D-erythritol kinase [Simkaniaceae bacterium]
MSKKRVNKLTLFSPAKINLNFKVIATRPDGYHEVDTEIQAVDLGDALVFECVDRDEFFCKTLPMDEGNLVLRALHLFREKSGIKDPISIHLHKNIPMGAGLGGGSSNAATTLFGLNTLFAYPFSEKQLQEMAALLGADVPFFFSYGSARCLGFGEIVTDISPRKLAPVTIAMPNFSIATQEVFKKCRIGESLEPAAIRAFPEMKNIREKLLAMGFSRVFMTG